MVSLGEARLGRIGLDEWLRRSRAAASSRNGHVPDKRKEATMRIKLAALAFLCLMTGTGDGRGAQGYITHGQGSSGEPRQGSCRSSTSQADRAAATGTMPTRSFMCSRAPS
jgi:hypothetical protein